MDSTHSRPIGGPVTVPGQAQPDFTRLGFRQLLSDYLDSGYRFSSFQGGATLSGTGTIILRHDIDLSIDMAVEMAEIEATADVQSTYFVLSNSPFYNLTSTQNASALQSICDLGHEVGLHIDASVYSGDLTQVIAGVKEEATLLERITGRAITMYSMHKPGPHISFLPETIGTMTSAYAARFVDEISYSSDSKGWWRFGDFRDSIDFRNRKSLQLLIHPIWWMQEEPLHPALTLDEFIRSLSETLQFKLAMEISAYGVWRGLLRDYGGNAWPTTLPGRTQPTSAID